MKIIDFLGASGLLDSQSGHLDQTRGTANNAGVRLFISNLYGWIWGGSTECFRDDGFTDCCWKEMRQWYDSVLNRCRGIVEWRKSARNRCASSRWRKRAASRVTMGNANARPNETGRISGQGGRFRYIAKGMELFDATILVRDGGYF